MGLGKLELECKILAGAESKAFLVELSKLTARLEQVAGMLRAPGEPAPAVDADDEDELPPPVKKLKKAIKSLDDEDEEETAPAPSDEDDEDDMPAPEAKGKAKPSFDDTDDEESAEGAPAPKKGKAAKLTIDDVNDACIERAGRTNRAEVLSVLKKKFGVKSVTDLKPEQYADVVKAMAGK